MIDVTKFQCPSCHGSLTHSYITSDYGVIRKIIMKEKGFEEVWRLISIFICLKETKTFFLNKKGELCG